MSVGRAYGAVLAGTGLLVLGLSLVLPETAGRGLRIALAAALLVQGPLGWWLVSAVGTPLLLPIWMIGMLGRLLLVALMALVAVPAFGWPAEATLASLAGLLLVFLVLEGVVLTRQHSRIEGR